jgi:hypothetical protein
LTNSTAERYAVQAMAEQEDQYGSTPLPLRADHVAPVPSSDADGRTIVPPASDSRPDAPPPLTVKVASDAVAAGVSEARAHGVSITLRPVEAMLRDPLGEVARKERRSLLGISAIAILVGRTGLVPAKIENFGIAFATPERQALLGVFIAVVGYYTLAFIIYSISDALGWGYAMYRGREELRKQIEESRNVMNTLRGQTQPVVAPWRFVGLVTPASLLRGAFDFAVPLAVAAYAICSLWGAVHQVTPKESTTVTPAVAPAVPPSR